MNSYSIKLIDDSYILVDCILDTNNNVLRLNYAASESIIL
jgi:hypothetical protein